MQSFEAHLTVNPEDEQRLQEYCKSKGHKFMCALNDAGTFPRQAMISIKNRGISEWHMVESAKQLARAVAAEAKIPVVRTKVEELVERAVRDGEDERPVLYWETHLKVPVLNAEEMERLQMLSPHMHLSRNVTKYPLHNAFPTQMLLTLRERGTVKSQFMRTVDELCDLVLGMELQPAVTVHRERVLYDDNVALDNGWIEQDEEEGEKGEEKK